MKKTLSVSAELCKHSHRNGETGTNISMPYCQAYGCSNKKYKEKDGQLRNYFTFPRIEKDKLRLERWLHNIGTGLQAKTFKWSINRTVCSDHFHENCFTSNKMAELLQNERKRVTLREGAVPTLFKHT